MKIKIIGLFLFINISLSCIGQQYYIGASIGWHQDIFTMGKTPANISNTYVFPLYNPSANIWFDVFFKNNIELSTGIGYYQSQMHSKIYTPLPEKYMYYDPYKEIVYDVLVFPINMGYSIKLWNKRLFFKIYTGFDFNINLSEQNEYDPNIGGIFGLVGCWVDYIKIPRFNILLSNRITLQYFTKFNMSIAIYGAYHAGLFQTKEVAALHFEYKSDNDPEWLMDEHLNIFRGQGSDFYNTKILSNGSYWQFGIELGYKFCSRKKKKI